MQPILIMVLKNGHKERDVCKTLDDLIRENKNARSIELENELCSMVYSDRSIIEFCQKIHVKVDLLATLDLSFGDLSGDLSFIFSFFANPFYKATLELVSPGLQRSSYRYWSSL